MAFLEGERKGQENLKRDLIRRIKMLEFALKQERWWRHDDVTLLITIYYRIRHHKLKFGTDLNLDLKNKDSSNGKISLLGTLFLISWIFYLHFFKKTQICLILKQGHFYYAPFYFSNLIINDVILRFHRNHKNLF